MVDAPVVAIGVALGALRTLGVARQLGSTAGAQLADAARRAFNTAAARGYLIVAVVGLIGAVWARWALRNAP